MYSVQVERAKESKVAAKLSKETTLKATLSPSHIPYKTSLRPEKDQKSVPITRPTCERRTLVLQVFEVL